MASIVQSNPHHRKIELQSPLDLQHLQTQLSTSARQKLNLHFPPTALSSKPATHIALGGSTTDAAAVSNTSTNPPTAEEQDEEETDPLRAHVSRLVTAFLTRTWSAAAPSISINGLDAHTLPQFIQPPPNKNNNNTTHTSSSTPSDATVPTTTAKQDTEGVDFTYTPYDARLQTRLADLYGELEALTAQVAKLRREAPKRGADAWVAGLQVEVEAEDGAWEEVVQGLKREASAKGDGGAPDREQGEGEDQGEGGKKRKRDTAADDTIWRDDWDEARREEVREAYETAVGELGRLARPRAEQSAGPTTAGKERGLGDLMATSGKMLRARRVAEELE